MTMTKTGASAPSGSQTTTTFQLGTYNAVTDTFTSSIDLNDQATYFLKPGTKQTSNPKLEQKSTAVRADNVRAHGSNVVKDHLDNIVVTAMFSIKSTTEQGVTDAWNSVVKLVKGQQGSAGGTLCLRFCWPKGTAYSYLDIQYAAVQAPPGNPLEVLAKAQTGIGLILEGGYAWRGDRLTYQNLVPNPGFEYPIGGSLAPAVLGFSDAFSNVNAYSVQAGSAPTTAPANTYVDVVYANCAPVRYYRLGLADDSSHAYDIGGYAQTGTLHNAPTQAVAGLVSGDTDTCYTFAAANSQWVDCTTGSELPTGNTAMTLFCLFKISAAPGSTQYLMSYGASGGATNHKNVLLGINSSGKLVASNGSTVITGTTTITNNVTNLAAVSWDGTTMTLSLNGGSEGTSTPGAQTTGSNPGFNLAVLVGAGSFFSGQLDECVLASGAVGLTALTNIYNAAHSGATGNTSNTMSVAAASRLSFGSPAWGAVQTWKIRFRYATSQVGVFYLHYTDANNNLAVNVQSGSNNYKIVHTIGGVANTLPTATVPLQHEAWYWLQVTQFPQVESNQPYLTAVLSYDNNASVGSTIATLTTSAFDAVTALVGRPQIAPTGATLVIGGLSSGLGHAWYNFGPGGWVTTLNGGTGNAACAWDGGIFTLGMSGTGAANTYSGGPWASLGALRIEGAAAGTLNAKAQVYRGLGTDGAPLTTMALPVATAGDVLEVSAWCKTNSVSGTATLSLSITEYNSSGTSLRTDTGWTAPSKTAAQAAAWVQLSGTYTTGANCAYVDIACVAIDSTANSAGKAFWFDNVLVQDRTFTGTTNMDYCELRFPNSPAMPQISGVQGTVAAPCLGMLASLPNSTISTDAKYAFLAGRRLQPTSGVQLIGLATVPVGAVTLDSTSYGGCYTLSGSGTTQTPIWFSGLAGNATAAVESGVYYLVARYRSANTTTAGVTLQAQITIINSDALISSTTVSSAVFTGPLASLNTWGQAQLGKFDLTLSAMPTTTDKTLLSIGQVTINGTLTNTTGDRLNSLALIPVDGGVVTGTLFGAIADGNVPQSYWFWCYMDGMDPGLPRWAWNDGVAGTSVAEPAQGLNTALGTSGSVSNLVLAADPFFTLDPTTTIGSGSTAVNQFVVQMDDTSGQQTVMPILAEFTYSPYWLNPR